MEVRFDGGDYLQVVMRELFSGVLLEGDDRKFRVGDREEIINDAGETESVLLNGAVMCLDRLSDDVKAEMEVAMGAIYDRIAENEFADQFDAIRATAYGG
jgi:hypothetical protein